MDSRTQDPQLRSRLLFYLLVSVLLFSFHFKQNLLVEEAPTSPGPYIPILIHKCDSSHNLYYIVRQDQYAKEHFLNTEILCVINRYHEEKSVYTARICIQGERDWVSAKALQVCNIQEYTLLK